MRSLLLLGVVTLLIIASSKSHACALHGRNHGHKNDHERSESPLRAIESGVNAFSTKFVQAVAENKTGNLVSSPLSAHMVLSMLTYGAKNNTEEELRSVLGLPEGNFTERGIQSLVDSFANVRGIDLRLANIIFLANTVKPKTAFIEVTKTVFRSKARIVDFGNSIEASKSINQWCEENTNNRIKDLISPAQLSQSTLLVLVNALYFKGNWRFAFDPQRTSKRPFHFVNGTINNVTTMHATRRVPYGEIPEVDAKFITLPYKSEDRDALGMFIILPNKVNGLVDLTNNLGKVDIAGIINRSWRSRSEVDVHLPKFTITSTINLNEPLGKLGLAGIFDNSANFSGIVDSLPLVVNEAVQKTFIEVNEVGSTAAAASDIHMMLGSSRGPKLPPIDFDVNRPFLSVIATRSGHALFVAMVNDPTL